MCERRQEEQQNTNTSTVSYSTPPHMKALYPRVHTPVSQGGGWGGGHPLLLCPPGLSTKQQENCHFCPSSPFLHLFPSLLKAIVTILSKSQFWTSEISYNTILLRQSIYHKVSINFNFDVDAVLNYHPDCDYS